MPVLSRHRPALILALVAAIAPAAHAADPTPASTTTAPSSYGGTADRLFLSFAQDAAMVPSQWWEGQLEYADGSDDLPVDVLTARAVVAFQPIRNLEVGGRVGFATSDADPSLPDGSGATDLDVYGKWFWGGASSGTDFTAGVLATVPTGDDTAGLGFNSFSGQAFGAIRHRMESAIVGGHIGARFNGDGDFQGTPINGKESFELGVAVVFPLANEVSLVGEARVETERFEGSDSTAEILAGINWKAFGRGMLRGAVSAGLTGAAPDFRVLVGYAYTF
ncbi:MAG TPA: hypothetical protein VFB67_02560 [Candidatus Polarisedimenticolaceae bacterium]|nr:hypothetical protein [Candidatus Polarisedimenticolaceae bacterium]